MKGGFSFDGVDVAELGLEYAPPLEDMYTYGLTTGETQEQIFESHDGGYYYGTSLQPKEFTLRCYFEENHVDRGVMAKIYHFFRIGKTGKLIFKRRPWCYYVATITDVSYELFNYENGFVTVSAKAYYPFARSDVFSAPLTHRYYAELKTNTAVVTSKAMVPPMEIDCGSGLTEATELLLLNPGSESAAARIEIAGDATAGVILENRTTGNACKYIGLTKEVTTNAGKYLCTDSLTGKTTLESDSSSENCFLYHDSGFIYLAPAYPAMRDVYAQYDDNDTVTITNMLYDINEYDSEDVKKRFVGKHIFLNNAWREIVEIVDAHTLKIKDNMESSGVEPTMILQLNKIVITPVNSMSLTRLSFKYKPTYT